MNQSMPLPTGGQILVDCLKVHGVELAFCVPGESYLAVLDALYDVRERVQKAYGFELENEVVVWNA